MSNEAKFTKGEWIVYTESDWHGRQDWDEIVIGMGTYNDNPYQHYCCHKVVIEDEESSEEAIANAHLIAAAPEMYDLLNSIENDSGQIPSWLYDKIQKTLAKARGE